MGLFSSKKGDHEKEDHEKENHETEEQMVKRLAKNAGNIIAMLQNVLKSDQGVDLKLVLLYASGLAGYACHQAVLANEEEVALVETGSGKKYYYGDTINKYLLENQTGVYSFCSVVCDLSPDEVKGIVAYVASSIGTKKLAIWGMEPDGIYTQIRDCWDGIYNNMTAAYCQSPAEWPVLYSIVLQNVIAQAVSVGAPRGEIGKMAMECAVVIAHMGDESIA